MSLIPYLLNRYQAELVIIQKNGLEAYQNKVEDATVTFKTRRTQLAGDYGQQLLDALAQEHASTQLYWVSEISHNLSRTPVQKNSKASVLLTFSYQFLRTLNDRVWGFWEKAAELTLQQKCSAEILFAAFGKQQLDGAEGDLHSNADVVCIALQYLFICLHQNIFDSAKHRNVKKCIDVNFKLNKNSLEIALNSLYGRLSYEDQETFLALIDKIVFQFTNVEIIKVLLDFKNKMGSTNQANESGHNFSNSSFDLSSIALSAMEEIFDGSEAMSVTRSTVMLNHEEDEKINPIVNKVNPYGVISAPPKKVDDQELMPIKINENLYETIRTPPEKDKEVTVIHFINNSATLASEEKNNNPKNSSKNDTKKAPKSAYDLEKIVWGVPSSNEERGEQIEYFKRHLLNAKNLDGNMRICIALQFTILLKDGNETIYAPGHWGHAMAIILKQSAFSLSNALVFIGKQLKTNEEKINFIRVLNKVSYSFRGNEYAHFYKAITSFKKDLQTAIRTMDENVVILRSINVVNNKELKQHHDDLQEKNMSLLGLINDSISAKSDFPEAHQLYEEIKKIREQITRASCGSNNENNNNGQTSFQGHDWNQPKKPFDKNNNATPKQFSYRRYN